MSAAAAYLIMNSENSVSNSSMGNTVIALVGIIILAVLVYSLVKFLKSKFKKDPKKKPSLNELIAVMKVGRFVLDDIKKAIGEKEYKEIMLNPIKGCSCGFIEEGNEEMCPKCESDK